MSKEIKESPRIKPYRAATKAMAEQLKFECRGKIDCPITNERIYGYGYGRTIEQAYYNWRESPLPF